MKAFESSSKGLGKFFAGLESGLPESNSAFKAMVAWWTALKSTGELVRSPSWKGVAIVVGVVG